MCMESSINEVVLVQGCDDSYGGGSTVSATMAYCCYMENCIRLVIDTINKIWEPNLYSIMLQKKFLVKR